LLKAAPGAAFFIFVVAAMRLKEYIQPLRLLLKLPASHATAAIRFSFGHPENTGPYAINGHDHNRSPTIRF
jgi:hypothetical protein